MWVPARRLRAAAGAPLIGQTFAQESAGVVQRIVDEEVGHVGKGMRWFCFLCDRVWRRLPLRAPET